MVRQLATLGKTQRLNCGRVAQAFESGGAPLEFGFPKGAVADLPSSFSPHLHFSRFSFSVSEFPFPNFHLQTYNLQLFQRLAAPLE